MSRLILFTAGAALVVVLVASRLWLPLLGTLMVVDDEPPQPATAALLLDGSASSALDGAEAWRQSGLVQEVVVVEGPIKSHALVAYWTDFVAWGLARPSPTPSEHLHVVRTEGLNPASQARAALPVLTSLGARSVLTPGGWLGSRLARRQLDSVLSPAGIEVRLSRLPAVSRQPAAVSSGTQAERDPGHWYLDAQDRRAVLDLWVQWLVPFVGDE
jgi:hypothetical protein